MSGAAAFGLLPVAPLPQVDFPTISVQARMPGASPATMASSVASPLERRLGTIAGVNEMTSQSGIGSSRITLQFDLNRDIDGAARDVQAAINAARADLPAALKSNPTYQKVNPADSPILILALTSATLTPSGIYGAVSNIIQQRVLQVEGVGDVELGGAALPGVRIDLDPLHLAQLGVSLEDVRSALSSASANRPRGVVEGERLAWQIYGNAAAQRAADYRDLIVAWRNGAAVRLGDVAHVYDGPEDERTMGLYNGRTAVMVIISRQPGANIVATVDAVKAEIPALQSALPGDVKLHIASDRTTTIRASLREVEITLIIATLLVVLVVSVFLRSLRATLVPAVAVVVSLLGTVGVMYVAGFSLNNLSLMALTIATGFVVDDAIVVLENISRHVEDGMQPFAAALLGAREVGFTVVSISISLVAVFIPLLFMGGIIGRLFREFAITMSVAVMISLVISLTATPMIAARVLRTTDRQSRIAVLFERWLGRAQTQYARNLDWALAHRGVVLLILLAAAGLNVALLSVGKKGFFPEQDTSGVMGGIRADQSISFSDTRKKLAQIVKIITNDPSVANVVAFTGGARAGGGFLYVNLKPKGQRDPSRAVIARLRPQLARVTGVSAFLNPVQDLRVGGRGTTSTYQYTLRADDPETLRTAGNKLVDLLKADSAFTDVDVDQQDGGAEVYVQVDRASAARLGISAKAIDAALYDSFGQRQVATIYSGLNQYHVVMGVADEFSGSPAALDLVHVPLGAVAGATVVNSGSTPVSSTGSAGDGSTGSAVSIKANATVPLSAIAHWANGSTAARVNHDNGQPAATVSFNLANNVSLGQAAARLLEIQQSAKFPSSVHGSFAGTAKAFSQSTTTMPLLILAALVVIYIVLGILYESAIHPLTVMSTLPSAGVGAALALLLTGSEFDLIALIGLILLIGIVKKNAIMIIDFALDAERSRGISALEAVREAALLRFRPILMTTLAAALGALPLAIGFGEGAELRRPLGITIIGGLIASQVLTLLTTPVVYLALDRFRRRSSHEELLARHGDPVVAT